MGRLKYKMTDLGELYRVDKKYWETFGLDVLPLKHYLAKKIDKIYWDCITSLVSLVTRKHLPFQTLVDVLKVLGYEAEEGEEECEK